MSTHQPKSSQPKLPRKREKPIIGWREWLELPECGIKEIKAKVDSGARTSALHAEEISLLSKGGQDYVRFRVYPIQREKKISQKVTLPLIEMRWIKSSVGHRTLRPVVETMVKMGNDLIPIELTLVNRDLMGFRMLLGREAIRNRFLLDTGRSFLLDRAQKKRPKRP